MNSYVFTVTVFLIYATEASCAEFIDHPRNAAVMDGDNITIPCIFKDKVDFCRWYRDPGILSIIDVKMRYSYNDTAANGNNTRDCSIIITNFTTIDEAFWQCSGTRKKLNGTANITNEIKSNKAHLTMDKSTSNTKATMDQKETSKTSEVIVHPQNATVLRGSDIILICVFKEVISNCSWCRNGTIVKIENRYKYHSVITKGLSTKDCSIKIKGFDEIDVTHWQCACAVSDNVSEIGNCKSNPAYLTMKHLNATTESPMKTSYTSPHNTRHSGHLIEESKHDTISVNILGVDLNMTNLLILVVIGVLLVIIISLSAIYCHRIYKDNKKRKSEPSVALAAIPNNQLRRNSSLTTIRSTETNCTLCHQLGQEPRSPGSVWSSCHYDHRQRCLPLPQLDEDLPPSYEADPRHDESEGHPDDRMTDRQSTVYMTIDDIKPTPASATMTDASCSATCNPLYEPVSQNSEETEPEVEGSATDIVHFQPGYRDAVNTRVQRKKKNSNNGKDN